MRARLRDLGIVTGLLPPGPLNAITDVEGVRVGYSNVQRDERTNVRTGVTAIWPGGNEIFTNPIFAGAHSFNGNGEMTGMAWLAEQGLLSAPVCITNTNSVGVVRDAVCELAVRENAPQSWHLPVVGETCDGILYDPRRFDITRETAFEALDSATAGPVAEGNIGGGAGMIAHGFKGGTGTASRVVEDHGEHYTVGALAQANYGTRELFRVNGVPVGRHIGPDVVPLHQTPSKESGSIIVVLATDAPLLPIQCQRLARRATVGLAWVGGIGGNGSGDIFMAFSTANQIVYDGRVHDVRMVGPDAMTPLFQAAAEATEEAILNALCMAETMTGYKGNTAHAIPLDLLKQVMSQAEMYRQGPLNLDPRG
jgi:D-aminopeptidase